MSDSFLEEMKAYGRCHAQLMLVVIALEVEQSTKGLSPYLTTKLEDAKAALAAIERVKQAAYNEEEVPTE